MFIIGHLRGSGGREVFPIERENGQPIKIVGKLDGTFRSVNEILDVTGSSTCLNTMGGGNREPKVMVVEKGIANTLDTGWQGVLITGASLRKRENMELEIRKDGLSNSLTQNVDHHLVKDSYRIRKLTPKECWRLQGFPDWAFQKAEQVNSNSQLYKQAGNSVTVNVVHEIAKRLKEDN